MNRKWMKGIMYCFLFFVTMGFASCVDDQYDLSKDIDMTITVGGDLAIPGSNTEDISLEKILDLDQESVVYHEENGDYVLSQVGRTSVTNVTIDKVSVAEDDIKVDTSEAYLTFNSSVTSATVSDEVNEKNTFVIDSEVTSDVVALKQAQVNMPVSFRMHYQGDAGTLYLKQGFAMVFPGYLTLTTNDPNLDLVIGENENKLVFKQDVQIRRNGVLNLAASVTAIDFEKLDGLDMGLERGHIYIKDDIYAVGTALVNASEFDTTDRIDLTLITDVKMGKMTFSRAIAKVDPEIDIQIEPVQIFNVPDFMDGEDVKINMTDPRVFIQISNATPVSINLLGDLVPVKDGQLWTDKAVHLGSHIEDGSQIIVPGNVSDYIICLHQVEDCSGIEADQIVVVPDLNNLIERIPDEIRMESVEANAVQEFIDMKLGGNYSVVTTYSLKAPLQFSEGTEVVYQDQLDGWNGDMEDYDFKEVVVSLKATSSIPLEINLTVDAIDAEGNVLPDVTATVEGNIPAGTPEQKSESELKVVLKSSNTETLHRLDGLKYQLWGKTTSAVSGTVLNKNQALRLDDIRIQLKGGITMDMN